MRVFQALETVSQLSDSAEPFSSRPGFPSSTIHTVRLFEELFLVFTILLPLLLLCCTVWMFRLNRRLKIDDLAGTISSLVKNILRTDIVAFYTYDPKEKLLRRIVAHGHASRAEAALPVGKGLVGTAAKDRMIITTEYFNRKHLEHEDLQRADRRLWMAAPILFEKKILGAIAVGKPERPTGGEKDLLSIASQIAGVVLFHQSFLIRARRNADTDVLTGLNNRRYFHQMSQSLVERATKERKSHCDHLDGSGSFQTLQRRRRSR